MPSDEPAQVSADAEPEKSTTSVSSDEAQQLADIAAETVAAFEARFHGSLSWTLDQPGMLTVDESATRKERLILDLIVSAYTERVRNGFMWGHHQHMRQEQLADEKRRQENQTDYSKLALDVFKQAEAYMKGEKHLDANYPKTQAELAANAEEFMRRIGFPSPGNLPPYPPGDDPPAEGSADSGSESGKDSEDDSGSV